MTQLLLTRAHAQNTALIKQVARPDLPSFSLPLLEAKEVEVAGAMKNHVLDLDQFDQIVFISKNAVNFGVPLLEQYWPQWPIRLQWFAVGSATAATLQGFGINSVYPELASSEGLLEMDDLKQVSGNKVLIVRGVGGRETLKTGLLARGAIVEYLEVYERQALPYRQEDFPQGDDVVALLYSGEAIERLVEIIDTRSYRLIVPSKRLQELAIGLGFDKVELASNQEDDSMIEVLTGVLERLDD